MRRARRTALLLPLLSLAPAAFASETKNPGRFKLGPVWLTPKLVVRSAGKDTNVFNAASNEVADTSVVITPSLDAVLPAGRRLRLLADGAVNFNYFQRERSERSTDIYGNGRAELDLGPFTLFGGAGAGRYKQRFSIEVDQRLQRHETQLSGGVIWRATPKLSLTADGRRQVNTYESGVLVGGSDVKESLDRRSLIGGGRVSYSLTDQTTLAAFGEIRQDVFTAQQGSGPDEARSYLYGGGFQFGEKAVLNGKATVGLRQFPNRNDQAVPPFRGFYIDVDVTAPFFHVGRLGIAASRDVLYAVTRAETEGGSLRNSYVALILGGNLSVELPWSLIGRMAAGFERAAYLRPYVQDGAPFDRVDNVRTYGGGLLRAFGTSVRVGATVQWSRRTSNLKGFGYTGLRYGLSAEITP